METESDNFFTRNLGEGDVILHLFKVVFIALTLIIGAIIIHLEHNINTISSESDHSTTPFDPSLPTSNPIIYTDSYTFTASLLKATEQLQDAMSLILSNYSGSDSDIDAELAWKNCSGSLLNGWGEIQDVLEHVIMNPFMERPSDEQRAEMTSQIIAAEGFITSCVDDLGKVESTAASEVRAKMLLAKVYLSGRGDFLISYYDDISNRLLRVIVAAWVPAKGLYSNTTSSFVNRTHMKIMESVSNNNLKTHFIEEDPNSLAFRRRNNAIIFIFLCIIITLALMLASSFFYIMHNISESDQPLSRAVRAYYSVASNTPSCLDMFMEIVSIKSDADPNQIFALSLQSAAEDLDIILASFILPNSDTEPAYKNCSSTLLRHGSGQIRHALAALRVNPAVDTLSGEERSEMMKWIVAAEESLNSCIDDLWKAESTAVSDVREKVFRVKAYVRSGEEFLARHDVVMRRFRGEIVAGPDYWRRNEVLKDLVILCLSGLYLCFLLCILRAICRFVGVKIPPLGNVFRALFTGAIWRRSSDSYPI